MEGPTHNVGDILLDRYQILSILGQGGIGITYRALRLGDRTPVALKSLALRSTKSWKALELFEREAKVLANLHHPAIPAYVDYFEIDSVTDRQFYIVQELVEGQSLSQMMDNGWHGTESEIRAIAQEILDILIYLHGLLPPVVHRDIKPQNIIRRADGKIFLVDFGAVQDTYRQTEVGSSTVVGTYGFMAPEQFRGKALPQTDLYALGATVLYLLTGRSPTDLPEKKLKINFRAAVQVSEPFAQWLDRMLEPDYEERFASAAKALAALESSETTPEFAPKSSIAPLGDQPEFLRPLGSKVKLMSDGNILNIHIPPVGFNAITAPIFGFALFWNGFLIFWTLMALRGGLFVLFSIPFWIIGIGIGLWSLQGVIGTTTLYMDAYRFRLTHRLFQYQRYSSGASRDLTGVEIHDTGAKVNEQKIFALRLQHGVQHHDFGSFLTSIEKEWLAHEIRSFIKFLKR